MSSKYQALIKSNILSLDISKEEILDDKQRAANYFVNRLSGKNKWLLKRNVRRLAFHIDLGFVRTALMKLYKETTHEDVKSLIKDIHNGTHNLDDLIAEMEDENEYNKMLDALDRELVASEFAKELEDGNFIQDQISLLKMKIPGKNEA